MGIFKKIYAAAGVLLVIGVAATGTYGLPAVDREIYVTAIDIQDEMQENGFSGFGVDDKKVRFFNGSVDYVVSGAEVTKEEAVFDTFVGTTCEIDGEYQVILPTYDNFSEMFNILGTAQAMADGSTQFSADNYSTNAHVATLWHEAFHAWQLTNWEEEIVAQGVEAGLTETDDMQEIVVNDIDSNEALVVSFSDEMELLAAAYETTDLTEKKALVAEALEIAEARKAQLSEKNAYVEHYFEMMEGTARYVEAEAYRLLEGDEAWSQMYLGEFVYSNGSGKYYEMGMYKCLLLDQLAPEWKADFGVTDSLDTYLSHAITQ